MNASDWAALAQAIERAADDVRQNRAPPAPVSTATLADTLERVAAVLPSVILTLRAHRGVVAGADEILAALAKAGVPHAADIEAAMLALPGALEAANKYLPTIAGVLEQFRPTPSWQPGPRVER